MRRRRALDAQLVLAAVLLVLWSSAPAAQSPRSAPTLDQPGHDRDAPTAVAVPPSGAADDLAIIVHRSNPIEQLTLGELRRIFLFETQTWTHGRNITVVLRERGQPPRAEAIRLVCGISEEHYDQHIQLQTYRGKITRGPREILSAAAMQRFVFNVPGAIGYVNGDEIDPTNKVLRIDGRLPGDAGYVLHKTPRAAGRSYR